MSSPYQQKLQQLSKRTLKDHSTEAKDITNDVIADVFYDIVKDKRNEYTADVWKLLRQVYLTKQDAPEIRRKVLDILNNHDVPELDTTLQTRLNAEDSPGALEAAYNDINEFLYRQDRHLLDKEVEQAKLAKPKERKSFKEKYLGNCSLT